MANKAMAFMQSMNAKQTNKGIKISVDVEKLLQDIKDNESEIFVGKKGRYLNLFVAPKAKATAYGTHYVSVLPKGETKATELVK